MTSRTFAAGLLLLGTLSLSPISLKADVQLLNVSYDPTRELYSDFNKAFTAYWKTKTGENVAISTSNDGSGKQSRAIQDGTPADVATLALGYDIDAIYENGGVDAKGQHLIPKDWQSRLPHNSSPYTSTMVLLVGARWNYLAALSYAKKKFAGDEGKIREFLGKIYKNALKNGLPTGSRAASISFTERKQGEVEIAFENEALLMKKLNGDNYDIITPSISILAEPPVTIIDANVDQHHTRKEATAYLEYLYSPDGQDIIGRNFYRPIDPAASLKYAGLFKPLNLVTIADFGGWEEAQKTHFDDNGTFDQILKSIR